MAIQLWILGGTAAEGPDEHGCAHLLEHMVFKPTAEGHDLAAAVEGLGGDVNAFTSHDETVVYATVPAGHALEAIDALVAPVLRPHLTAPTLAVESEVVIEEIHQYRDDPGAKAMDALLAMLWGRHPYARPVLGTEAEIRSHDAARLRRFHRRIYAGRRARLVVVGPVDVDAIVARARPWLEALPLGSAVVEGAAPGLAPLRRPRVRVQTADVGEAHVQLAWRLPAVPDAEAGAVEIASIVLGYGESSRLTGRVRRGAQLVSDAVASFYPSRHGSSLVISAHTRASRIEAAVDGILDEVEALARVPLTIEELRRARAVLASDLVYRRETAQGHAHALGSNLSLDGSLRLDERIHAMLADHGPSSVRRACARWLPPGAAALSVVMPEGKASGKASGAKALRQALEARLRARGRATTSTQRVRTDRHGVHVAELPGGLRLLARVDRRVPMAAGWLLWPGGLRLEDARRHGASAMMATLLTRGCEAIDGDALAREIEGAAAALDGFSGRSTAGLHFECMASSVPLVLRRAIQCAQAPRFAADELEEERRVALEELRAEQDDPATVAYRLALSRLHRGHPFQWRRGGTPSTLARLTSTGLRRAWSRWYPLGRAVLAVSGDVDVEGLVGMLEDLLGEAAADAPPVPRLPTWPAAQLPARGPARPPELRAHRERAQSHLVLAVPGLALADRNGPALDLLLTVLGGQAGRLFMALREAEGLVYAVSAGSREGIDRGDVSVHAASSADRLPRARTVLEAELQRICDELVPEAELSRAKALLLGQHAIGLERHGRVASQLALHEAFGLPRHAHLRYPGRVERIDAQRLRTLARRIFDPQRRVVAIVGPSRGDRTGD